MKLATRGKNITSDMELGTMKNQQLSKLLVGENQRNRNNKF